MPGKKKKYNARFPPARIKKIMQSDDEVGKVAAPVPVIISRALEMFAETLLHRARKVTSQRGARTLTPSHLKFCIQSETRFDFLKELVGSVPELQGDMDVEGGLGVMGESRNTEHRPAGLGRARGVGRASVPGTGKRRGRPPKVAGAPPSARTKRSVEKFVEDEDDSGDIIEIESDHWPPPKKLCNGSSSNSPQTPSPLQSPQERLLLPQPETSQRLNSFSSPFNIQRSASQEDFVGARVAPSPSTTSSASSSSCPPGLSGLPFQLEINKDTTDSASPGLYQRTTSLPPPAPVYTGSYSRLFRSSSTSSNSLQATARNGAGTTFKLQTNGNFPVSGTHSQPSPASGLNASTSQTNPAGPGQELDEDYDC